MLNHDKGIHEFLMSIKKQFEKTSWHSLFTITLYKNTEKKN